MSRQDEEEFAEDSQLGQAQRHSDKRQRITRTDIEELKELMLMQQQSIAQVAEAAKQAAQAASAAAVLISRGGTSIQSIPPIHEPQQAVARSADVKSPDPTPVDLTRSAHGNENNETNGKPKVEVAIEYKEIKQIPPNITKEIEKIATTFEKEVRRFMKNDANITKSECDTAFFCDGNEGKYPRGMRSYKTVSTFVELDDPSSVTTAGPHTYNIEFKKNMSRREMMQLFHWHMCKFNKNLDLEALRMRKANLAQSAKKSTLVETCVAKAKEMIDHDNDNLGLDTTIKIVMNDGLVVDKANAIYQKMIDKLKKEKTDREAQQAKDDKQQEDNDRLINQAKPQELFEKAVMHIVESRIKSTDIPPTQQDAQPMHVEGDEPTEGKTSHEAELFISALSKNDKSPEATPGDKHKHKSKKQSEENKDKDNVQQAGKGKGRNANKGKAKGKGKGKDKGRTKGNGKGKGQGKGLDWSYPTQTHNPHPYRYPNKGGQNKSKGKGKGNSWGKNNSKGKGKGKDNRQDKGQGKGKSNGKKDWHKGGKDKDATEQWKGKGPAW